MLHTAWNSKGEMPYRFPRSSVKFQGHTVQNITDFDPNWAFPDYRPVAAFKSLRFALFFYLLWCYCKICFIKVNKLYANCKICFIKLNKLYAIYWWWTCLLVKMMHYIMTWKSLTYSYILVGLWLNCISSVEITLFLLADIRAAQSGGLGGLVLQRPKQMTR